MANLRDRFHFGEIVCSGEVQSYLAHDRDGNAAVLIHLIAVPGSDLDQLLSTLCDAYGQTQPPVLEVGSDGGKPYAVTQNLPEFRNFAIWLRNLGAGLYGSQDDPLLKHRVWKLPHADIRSASTFPAPDDSQASGSASGSSSTGGDFSASGLFGTSIAHSDPTALTRIFQSSVQSSASPAAHPAGNLEPPQPAVPAPLPRENMPAYGTDELIPPVMTARTPAEPGEFTRRFQSAPVASAGPPISSEPGEFTRMFMSPPRVPAAKTPADSAADEVLAEPPSAASEPQTAPSASAAAAPSLKPGDFTRIFPASSAQQPPIAPASPPSATGVLATSSSSVTAGGPQRPVQSSGPGMPGRPLPPSEFTKIFKRPTVLPNIPGVPEATSPSRDFEAARGDVYPAGARALEPLQPRPPAEATNLFNVPPQPLPSPGPLQGEKSVPYMGTPVFGGGTLQPAVGIKLSTPGPGNAGGNPANLGLFVPESPTGAYGATRVFETSQRSPNMGSQESESEYSRVFRPSPVKPASPPAPPDSSVTGAKKEFPLAHILTLVLLLLTAIGLILFFGISR